MTSFDIRPMTVLECVMARPGLYTPHGSVSEVVAYLCGYEGGVLRQHHAVDSDDWNRSAEARELKALLEWLQRELRLEPVLYVDPPRLVAAITAAFPDETTFFAACRDFLANRAAAAKE